MLLPIALLALTGDMALIFVLTAASRLVAPLDLIRLRGGISWPTEVWLTTVIALWLPLAFIAARAVRARMVTPPDGISVAGHRAAPETPTRSS